MSEGTLALPRPSAPKPLLRMLPDDRLAKMAAEGSVPAFAAIYARHHQPVYRYCRSILGSEHDARDALQNAMEKAFKGLEGETREIALRPWLFRIAHNEAVSLLRARPAASSLEEDEVDVPASDSDPETRQRLRELIDDLELLTPRQRSALVMRELSGLEFAEVGAALETSAEGAKQAVYEARVALHELVEGREMPCEEIRRKISSEDRRLLKGRRVRAHLRTCEGCRDFEAGVGARKQRLAAIAPPLPAPAAVAILEGIIGGGGGAGGAIAGGGFAGVLGGGGLLKAGAAGLAAVAVGTGVYAESRAGSSGDERSDAQQEQISGTANGERADRAAHDGGVGGSKGEAQAKGGTKGEKGSKDDKGNGGSGTQGQAANGTGPPITPPGQGGAIPGQGNGPPITPPGQGGANPGAGGGAPPITPPGATNPGAGGGAPPITPPGQGG